MRFFTLVCPTWAFNSQAQQVYFSPFLLIPFFLPRPSIPLFLLYILQKGKGQGF